MSIILKKTIERKTVIRQQHELPRKESVILHGQLMVTVVGCL